MKPALAKCKPGYFVSTLTTQERVPTKAGAIARAKVLGGHVFRACECGCGEPAGVPVYEGKAGAA